MELHTAQERQRLLEVKIRDMEAGEGALSPQDVLSVTEVRTKHLEATRMYDTALRRFAEFVTKGIVPQDTDI